MFEIGDIVECIHDHITARFLSVGSRYTVLDADGAEFPYQSIKVKDNEGGEKWWKAGDFKLVYRFRDGLPNQIAVGDKIKILVDNPHFSDLRKGDVVAITDVGECSIEVKGDWRLSHSKENKFWERYPSPRPAAPDYLAKAKAFCERQLKDNARYSEDWNDGFYDAVYAMMADVFDIEVDVVPATVKFTPLSDKG